MAKEAEKVALARITMRQATLGVLISAASGILIALIGQGVLSPNRGPGSTASAPERPSASPHPAGSPNPGSAQADDTKPWLAHYWLPTAVGLEPCKDHARSGLRDYGIQKVEAARGPYTVYAYAGAGRFVITVTCIPDYQMMIVSAAGPESREGEILMEQLRMRFPSR